MFLFKRNIYIFFSLSPEKEGVCSFSGHRPLGERFLAPHKEIRLWNAFHVLKNFFHSTIHISLTIDLPLSEAFDSRFIFAAVPFTG